MWNYDDSALKFFNSFGKSIACIVFLPYESLTRFAEYTL